MIRYALRCAFEHEFEAWFASSGGFDDQVGKGLVECPMCGSTSVSKAIMAPMVHTNRSADRVAQARRAVAEAMHRLRSHVEKTHDYVGGQFASEARDIHEGLAPDRPIYGEATHDEVRALVEDGVPVAALPVFPAPDDGAIRPALAKKSGPATDKKLN